MRAAHPLESYPSFSSPPEVIGPLAHSPHSPLPNRPFSPERPLIDVSPGLAPLHISPNSFQSEATEPLKPTNRFSIASLVLNQSPSSYCGKSTFEEHIKTSFDRQLHLGMGVLPVQDFESRQLAEKLKNLDDRYKAAPILSLENKSDQEDEDIDDDSMSIKVDEEDKDNFVSGYYACNCATTDLELAFLHRKENRNTIWRAPVIFTTRTCTPRSGFIHQTTFQRENSAAIELPSPAFSWRSWRRPSPAPTTLMFSQGK